jgi:hypothetical protein
VSRLLEETATFETEARATRKSTRATEVEGRTLKMPVYREHSPRPHHRRHEHRRMSDRYTVIVQCVILAVGAVGMIYGQAELLGEPWRHVLAVGCVVVLVAVAMWMKVT